MTGCPSAQAMVPASAPSSTRFPRALEPSRSAAREVGGDGEMERDGALSKQRWSLSLEIEYVAACGCQNEVIGRDRERGDREREREKEKVTKPKLLQHNTSGGTIVLNDDTTGTS